MKFDLKIEGDFKRIFADDLKTASDAITSAVTKAGNGLKSDLRTQLINAGLGRKLANSVRLNIYPKSRQSLDSAAFVFARPGKGGRGGAADIVAAFEEGSLIQRQGGRYLAIPTEHVPRKSGSGRRMTPSEMQASIKSGGFGQDLKLVPTNRPGIMLLVLPVVRSGASQRPKPVSARRLQKGGKAEWIAMFILTRQVQMPRLLDWRKPAEDWGSRLEGLVISEWENRQIRV